MYIVPYYLYVAKRTQAADPALDPRRPSVTDRGPTSAQHRTDGPCQLGH